MVLINNVKYACERCIRGHRVTTCNHTDQPLMMIKPKGRPSTTCDHCKELRKNKNANPSGVCTCGRLEKKRLAQRAKEEARAKAKEEKKIHDCRCSMDEPCKCHSTRRRNRKISINNNQLNNTSSSTVPSHVVSPVSMDTDSYLDSDYINNGGKISKDYHHVPSMASISSLHSTQSLDQKFSLPQSPTLGNFIGGNNPHWDNSSICSSVRSDSRVNLSDAISIGLDPLNSTKRVTPMTRTRVGEVTVPLEEYIPSDINGVGKINDTNSLMEDWSFENSNDNNNPSISATIANSNSNSFINNPSHDNTRSNSNNNNNNNKTTGNNINNSGLLDMFLDSSSIPTLSRANLSLQERNDNFPNGLTKRYSFHSPQDAYHHYNINNSNNHHNHETNRNNTNTNTNNNTNNEDDNTNMNNSHNDDNTNSNNNINNKRWDGAENGSIDNESVRSVEVLSLTPSFMDIPERTSNIHNGFNQPLPSRRSFDSQKSKQRSSSIHRNHRYPPSSSYASQSAYNMRAVPITINPSMVSTIDDNVSLHSLQSPTSSFVENGIMGSTTDPSALRNLPDKIKSPRSIDLPDKGATQQQSLRQLVQRQNSQSLLDSDMHSEIDQLMAFDGSSTHNRYDGSSLKNNKENGNLLFQDTSISFTNPLLKKELHDTSPASSNQTSSPPSQLLTEKGFADLDNFMSIL